MRAALIGDLVTAVSDQRIVIADGGRERVVLGCDPALMTLASLGGMSGSAVYIVDDIQGGPRLVGFMYQSSEGIHATIHAVHAAFILADGRLDFLAMPW